MKIAGKVLTDSFCEFNYHFGKYIPKSTIIQLKKNFFRDILHSSSISNPGI